MTRAWSRFRALSPVDRALVAEAAAVLAFVQMGSWLLPFSLLRLLLDKYAAIGTRHTGGSSSVPRSAWAVAAVARGFPQTTCLVQALAADVMLRRRGVTCDLRFGVRPGRAGADPLVAHAWIEHQGVVVLGALENLGDYAVLSRPEPL